MADGITLSTNIGSGAVIKTDDDGTYHWQVVKVAFGADNTQTEVTSSVGLPISDAGGSLTVDNAGTFVTQVDGAALTSLQLLDNYVYVDDADWTATTSSHALTGGIYQSSPGTVTDGDTGPFRMDANGAIHISDGGNTITVDGTVTANPASGTIDTVTTVTAVTDITNTIDSTISGDALTALQKIDDAVHVDDAAFTLGTSSGVMAMGFAGAQTVNSGDAAALACTTSGILHVSNATLEGAVSGSEMQCDIVAPLPAGTNAIGKLSANSGVDIGDVDILSLPASTNTIEVVGDVAHDAAAAGNPVLMGARATADVEALTEVAEADASYVATDLQGVVITRPYIAAQEHVQYHVVNTAGTELAVTGLDAGGAGVHNYVTSIIVHNAHASTNGFIQLLDGSGGTPIMTIPAPATGGAVINLNQPLKQTTANTALYWDASEAITTLYVTIIGYQGQG